MRTALFITHAAARLAAWILPSFAQHKMCAVIAARTRVSLLTGPSTDMDAIYSRCRSSNAHTGQALGSRGRVRGRGDGSYVKLAVCVG